MLGTGGVWATFLLHSLQLIQPCVSACPSAETQGWRRARERAPAACAPQDAEFPSPRWPCSSGQRLSRVNVPGETYPASGMAQGSAHVGIAWCSAHTRIPRGSACSGLSTHRHHSGLSTCGCFLGLSTHRHGSGLGTYGRCSGQFSLGLCCWAQDQPSAAAVCSQRRCRHSGCGKCLALGTSLCLASLSCSWLFSVSRGRSRPPRPAPPSAVLLLYLLLGRGRSSPLAGQPRPAPKRSHETPACGPTQLSDGFTVSNERACTGAFTSCAGTCSCCLLVALGVFVSKVSPTSVSRSEPKAPACCPVGEQRRAKQLSEHLPSPPESPRYTSPAAPGAEPAAVIALLSTLSEVLSTLQDLTRSFRQPLCPGQLFKSRAVAGWRRLSCSASPHLPSAMSFLGHVRQGSAPCRGGSMASPRWLEVGEPVGFTACGHEATASAADLGRDGVCQPGDPLPAPRPTARLSRD